MLSITTTVVPATVGPAELPARRTYVHDAELDDDQELSVGMRVEIVDEAGRYFAGTVTGREGQRWQLTLARWAVGSAPALSMGAPCRSARHPHPARDPGHRESTPSPYPPPPPDDPPPGGVLTGRQAGAP